MKKLFVIGNSHISQKTAIQLKKEGRDFVYISGATLKEEEYDLLSLYEIPVIECRFINSKALKDSGIETADCVIVACKSDEKNIYITILVREINPTARLIVEIFNDKIGKKLENQISNCHCISAPTLSAPCFATSAIYKHSYFSLTIGNELYSFVKIPIEETNDLSKFTKDQLETEYNLQIIHYEDENRNIIPLDSLNEIPTKGYLLVFIASKNIENLSKNLKDVVKPVSKVKTRKKLKIDRFLLQILLIIILVIFAATAFFHIQEKLPLLSSLYFVITTISTVGYGDISLKDSVWFSKIIGMGLMLAGLLLSALLFALVTDSFIKKRTDYIEGRHKFHLHNHVIICGLGTLGIKIIENLLQLDQQVLVIERDRDNLLLNELERLDVPYMIADASLEQTLLDANIEQAKSIICAMNGDLACLEIGLNARGLNPAARVVLRVFDDDLAKKIQHHFKIYIALSTSSLSTLSLLSYTHKGDIIDVIPYEEKALIIEKFKQAAHIPDKAVKLNLQENNIYCYIR